jgi:hypothetical protein
VLGAALWAGCCAAGAAATAGGVADPAIGRWITAHAKKMPGVELAEARYAVRGDVDGDGRGDVAVLYTLRGGGRDGRLLRFLAVFRGGQRGLEYRAHILVGGRGMREVNRATILQRTVEIEALEYRTGDAACCPTQFVKRRYRLTGRKLERAATAARGPHAKK